MNKYKAKKTTIDGITFDSKLEAKAYMYFKYSNQYVIHELQPVFELQEKFVYRGKTIRAINYVADFLIGYDGKFYVVDAKGIETPVFKLKLKLLKYKCPALNFILYESPRQFEKALKS